MTYLTVAYKEPKLYALMDLTDGQTDLISSALGELQTLYESMGAESDAVRPIEALIEVLDRRYSDD